MKRAHQRECEAASQSLKKLNSAETGSTSESQAGSPAASCSTTTCSAAVTVLKVIKAAQRLGFTLDEVADLLEAGRHPHRRADAGLQARAQAKLAEVEAKIADLQVIAGNLRAATDAGCDDLITCAGQSCCPIPFATIAAGAPDADPR
jgi:acetaldehyde dehydrogenase (acetylating)